MYYEGVALPRSAPRAARRFTCTYRIPHGAKAVKRICTRCCLAAENLIVVSNSLHQGPIGIACHPPNTCRRCGGTDGASGGWGCIQRVLEALDPGCNVTSMEGIDQRVFWCYNGLDRLTYSFRKATKDVE